MILHSYEVTNWGPHIHQKLVFPKEAKTIAICGENDQGKSWILRGIAFTLSIARNEYGDQTSIHVGEKEAHHKLVIEHNHQQYTIEKIVKGKSSQEEGTTTIINGEKQDKASLENFYSQTLGLPLPSIWLPICISMQNQTDFHLRSKKRDREEALRQVCQLTKIDSWKENLSSVTKEEERQTEQNISALKAKLEVLTKQIKETQSTERGYQSTMDSLLEHKWDSNAPEGTIVTKEEFWSHITKTTSLLKEEIREYKRKDLEKTNLSKEIELLAGMSAREEAEMVKLFPDNNQELLLTEKVSEIELKISILRAIEIKSKIRKLEDGLDKHRNDLSKINQKMHQQHQEYPNNSVSPSLADFEKIDQNIADKYLQISTLKNKLERIATIGRNNSLPIKNIYTNTIDSFIKLNTQLKKLELSDIPQDTEIYEKTKVCLDELTKHEEYKVLKETNTNTNEQNDTNHSNDSNDSSKNVDDRSLRLKNQFVLNFYREKLILPSQSLTKKGDLAECKICNTSLLNESWGQNISQDPNSEDLSLLIIETGSSLKEVLEKKLKAIGKANQKEERNKINSRVKAYESIDLLAQETKTLLENIKPLSSEYPPQKLIEQLEVEISTSKKIKELHENKVLIEREMGFTSTQLVSYKEQIVPILEELNTKGVDENQLDMPKEPSHSKDAKDLAMLTQELLEAKKIIKDCLEKKEKFSKKAKTIEVTKTKLSLLEKNKDEALKRLESLREEILAASLPIPLKNGSPIKEFQKEIIGQEELLDVWERRLDKFHKLETLCEPLPQRITKLRKEKIEVLEELGGMEEKWEKLEKSRKLVAFLDYKNAPRLLLEQIVDKLFELTNKLTESLSVDIKLLRGKNLEFLSRQIRHSKILEQKTERLGFGKGAILGICFRLACQRLLLPNTGFLILDEPTANVDNKRKIALKSFLQSLSESSQSNSHQILLIEHDQDVVELCQARIDVGNSTTVGGRRDTKATTENTLPPEKKEIV
jgi:DNA repair exonuclease SbcCD ATPase subunit